MATLLVSAAGNLALGFALNAIFPPPDVQQEGPRLTDLGFTAPALGKPVNVVFGTDRVDGSMVDNTDPAIEEVITRESAEVGKGGGQTVNTTSYTYFLTCRLSFAIEGAVALIRLWGDGKLIYDATGTGPIVREGAEVIFYPGGPTQQKDPEEVSRRGPNVPAYRHLTTVKLNRLPLKDFGNRPPNFTAEIAFAAQDTVPFIALDPEPSGFNPPGALTGADTTYMIANPLRNEVYGLKKTGGGFWTADASNLDFKSEMGAGGGLSDPTVGLDAVGYRQTGLANAGPIEGVDVETGEVLFTKGNSGINLSDDGINNWGNSGNWAQLGYVAPGIGVQSILIHLNGIAGPSNGSIVDARKLPLHNGGSVNANITTLGTGLGFPNQDFVGFAVPDHDRSRFLVVTQNGPNGTIQVMQIDMTAVLAAGGGVDNTAAFTVLRELTVGSPGDDFEVGDTIPRGWALDRSSGNLLVSNGSAMVLYNPDSDVVLATRQNLGFVSRNNYYNGSLFAFSNTNASGGFITLIDTRDLTTVRSLDTNNIPWPTTGSNNGVVHDQSTVWEDRTQALFLSRVDSGSNAPVDARVLKVFLNRVNGLGVPLDFVVEKISTSYNRLRLAGLDASDLELSALSGDTVLGYTLNNGGSYRANLQPLRDRFFFDLVQEDWAMKAKKRGGAPILTIPEEDVGELKRDRSLADEPAIREIRTEEIALPMRLNIRYKNKNADYNADMEHDKRILLPNPSMRSGKQRTLDIPIVDVPTPIKRTARQWLFTFWDERRAFKSVVPWTYLKLSPADVFNMGVFGETHVLRLSEQDIGAGFPMDITGIVQDTKQFSSTIEAGPNEGFVTPTLSSGLPTRLIPLDAPILSLQDFNSNNLSNAYMAFAAFEDSWPGGSSMRSLNDVDFELTATAKSEVPFAKVRSAPGAWTSQEGDFRNRWQETAEGGTMTVTVLRDDTVWASATELATLNGANTIAVIREADKKVEVLQFQDATVNDDNTVTLERLLRGRLGTEDVAELGVSVGDEVVLLADSAGSNDASVAGIQKQSFPVADLNTTYFFRGVTIGTLLEDAASESFAYTGRDLAPYSPAHASGAGDGSGGLDITWERRTRGPRAGEWLDGTALVPLNEAIERYEVTLNTPGAGDFVTKTVDDAKTVNFSQSDLSGAGGGGGFGPSTAWLAPDGSFPAGEDPETGGGQWVVHQGGFSEISSVSSQGNISAPPPGNTGGTNFMVLRLSASATVTNAVRQDVPLSSLGLDPNDVEKMTFFLSCWVAQDRVDGGVRVRLQLLNSAKDAVLAEANQGEFDTGAPYGDWTRIGSTSSQDFAGRPLKFAGVQGGAHLRVICYLFKRGTLFSTDRSAYDELLLEVAELPPDITAKVRQVSDSTVKSPAHEKKIT